VVELAVDGLDDDDESIRWNAAWTIERIAHDRRQRCMLIGHIERIEFFADDDDQTVSRAINSALMGLTRRRRR
jgi:hypothetical protein